MESWTPVASTGLRRDRSSGTRDLPQDRGIPPTSPSWTVGRGVLLPAMVLLAEHVMRVPEASADSANWALRLLAASYPLFDVVLLAALLWLAATPTLTRAHLGMLSMGMGLNLLVNMVIAVEVLSPASPSAKLPKGCSHSRGRCWQQGSPPVPPCVTAGPVAARSSTGVALACGDSARSSDHSRSSWPPCHPSPCR